MKNNSFEQKDPWESQLFVPLLETILCFSVWIIGEVTGEGCNFCKKPCKIRILKV